MKPIKGLDPNSLFLFFLLVGTTACDAENEGAGSSWNSLPPIDTDTRDCVDGGEIIVAGMPANGDGFGIKHLRLDGDTLYFTLQDELYRINRAGGEVQFVLDYDPPNFLTHDTNILPHNGILIDSDQAKVSLISPTDGRLIREIALPSEISSWKREHHASNPYLQPSADGRFVYGENIRQATFEENQARGLEDGLQVMTVWRIDLELETAQVISKPLLTAYPMDFYVDSHETIWFTAWSGDLYFSDPLLLGGENALFRVTQARPDVVELLQPDIDALNFLGADGHWLYTHDNAYLQRWSLETPRAEVIAFGGGFRPIEKSVLTSEYITIADYYQTTITHLASKEVRRVDFGCGATATDGEYTYGVFRNGDDYGIARIKLN